MVYFGIIFRAASNYSSMEQLLDSSLKSLSAQPCICVLTTPSNGNRASVYITVLEMISTRLINHIISPPGDIRHHHIIIELYSQTFRIKCRIYILFSYSFLFWCVH